MRIERWENTKKLSLESLPN